MNEVASRATDFLGSGAYGGSHICQWSDGVHPGSVHVQKHCQGLHHPPGSHISTSACLAQASGQGSRTPRKRGLPGDTTQVQAWSSSWLLSRCRSSLDTHRHRVPQVCFVEFIVSAVRVQRLKTAKQEAGTRGPRGLEDSSVP